jgi:hypothetical protein
MARTPEANLLVLVESWAVAATLGFALLVKFLIS